MRCSGRKNGFTLLELTISLGILGLLAYAGANWQVKMGQRELAHNFGRHFALYSQAVAEYIAVEGTAMPAGTHTGFAWLKDASCSGTAPEAFLPCGFEPRLPFNLSLSTEVIMGTGVHTDPCPEPVGAVCAFTTLSVPSVNGVDRVDLATQTLSSAQASSVSVHSTLQDFGQNADGEVFANAIGEQVAEIYLNVDGTNVMQGQFNMGDNNLTDVESIDATGDLVGARFIDRDDPSFVVDPSGLTIVNRVHGRGNLDATGGGIFRDQTNMHSSAEFEDEVDFRGLVEFNDSVDFDGGETTFNGQVNINSSSMATIADAASSGLVQLGGGLEIRGTSAVGNACDSTVEDLRFDVSGELLECVGGLWQHAGIDTAKATITYYSMAATNSYGEFHRAASGVSIPDRHHLCSAQSIEGSNQARSGGARVERSGSADSDGRYNWVYYAHAGLVDANTVPLELLSGNRTVACLTLGPDTRAGTVSTPTNSAPSGSVSCASGYIGTMFRSTASVSDPDTPISYDWSASGACRLIGETENVATIDRVADGTCTVQVDVTDYYGASRTISNSCSVWVPDPVVNGECGCSTNSCASGSFDPDPDEPGPPAGHDPVVDGPWDPPENWTCKGRNGGADTGCSEGGACDPPGLCAYQPNDCYSGGAVGLSTSQSWVGSTLTTLFTWRCTGDPDDNCTYTEATIVDCPNSAATVNGTCGTAQNSCNTGDFDNVPGNNWVCRGRCGGTTDTCTPPGGPPAGLCGPTVDSCDVGTFIDGTDTVTEVRWQCDAAGGTTNCSEQIGQCGSVLNTCNNGSFVDTTDTATAARWDCVAGGGTDHCSAPLAQCGATPNDCVSGAPVDLPDTPLEARWECNLAGVGTACAALIGQCGSTADDCTEGTLIAQPDSVSEHIWQCDAPGGITDCNIPITVAGRCPQPQPGAGPENTCEVGQVDDIADSATALLWNCETTLGTDNCSMPVDFGVCDLTTLNGCANGTLTDMTDTATEALWQCVDTGGTEDCSVPIGVCDASVLNGCSSGTLNDIADSSDDFLWNCEGVGGIDNCSTPIGVGQCIYTVVNTCAPGQLSVDVPDVPGEFRWQCDPDTPGGTIEDCALPYGQCTDSDTVNDCVHGAPDDIPDSATEALWRCVPGAPGTPEPCALPIGQCGSAPDTCDVGYVDDVADPPDKILWQCVASGGTSDCESGLAGVCDISTPQVEACAQGTHQDSPADVAGTPSIMPVGGTGSSRGQFRWTCLGTHGGADADCSILADDGMCDPANENGCILGTPQDMPDTVGFLDWRCVATVPGRSRDCQIQAPEDGECGTVDSAAGGCNAGIYEDEPGATWWCRGTDGGADVQCPPDPFDGLCGNVDNVVGGCIEGTYDDYDNGGTDWHCRGSDNTVETDDDLNCGGGVVNGVCGDADNATEGCDAGTYSDIAGDDWMCLGDNGGTDANCSVTQSSCYYLCAHWYDPGPSGQSGYILSGGCQGETGIGINYSGLSNCLTAMEANYCSPAVGNECCTAPGACPPGWVVDTDGICGTQDQPGPLGCSAGDYQDIPGPTWMCLGYAGGADVTCP